MVATMSPGYERSQKASYGKKKEVFQFRRDHIKRLKIPGTPLGMSARQNQIASFHYWQPRIDIYTEISAPYAPVRQFRRSGIFGCDFFGWDGSEEKTSVRILPDVPKLMSGGDKARGHALTWGPDGTLFVNRNGDGVVFQLFPPKPGEERWTLGKKFELSTRYIQAMHFDFANNTLHTIESGPIELGPDPWVQCSYAYHDNQFYGYQELCQVPFMTYALSQNLNGDWYYGADLRAPRTAGIYRENEATPIISFKNVGIDGLAFLSDGSIFASFYGESSVGLTEALGRPSELIYIPASTFQR